MVSKLDLAVVTLLVSGEIFWIEHAHRVVIDPPKPPELAETTPCPDRDTVPYSAHCLAFLNGVTGSNGRVNINHRATAETWVADEVARAAPAPCPERDTVPYTASCLAFLKGATDTGMRWRIKDDQWLQR